MKHTSILPAMIIAALTLSGCTSYNSLQLSKQQLPAVSTQTSTPYTYYKIDPPLYNGDVVQYVLQSGEKGTITVKKTTPQTLISDDGRVINLSDLASLKRKDISKGKTAAAVGTGVATTVVVATLVFTAVIGAGFAGMLSAS